MKISISSFCIPWLLTLGCGTLGFGALGNIGVSSEHSSIVWQTDYSTALKESRCQKKPLLLFFTGSDWSGWSMKMKKEVLDSEGFITAVAPHFLFVEIDFPMDSVLSTNLAEQNELLKKRFRVQQYPRLLLIDENERELARFGMEDEPTLTAELLDVVQKKKQLDSGCARLQSESLSSEELEQLYNIAADLSCFEEQQRLLSYGMQGDNPLFFVIERYRCLMEAEPRQSNEIADLKSRIVKLDPDNAKGAHLRVALIDFQTLESRGAQTLSEVVEPLERYLKHFGAQDRENGWRLELMVAQFYLNYDKCHEALEHAEIAFKLAPEVRRDEVGRSLDYIRRQAVIAGR